MNESGIAYFTSLSNVDFENRAKDDVFVLATVKGINHYGFINVKELAPKPNLFHQWRKHWKDSESNDWFKIFKGSYLKNFDNEAEHKLNIIIKLLDNGKNIYILCYCKNESICHRSILKEMISNKGYKTVSI